MPIKVEDLKHFGEEWFFCALFKRKYDLMEWQLELNDWKNTLSVGGG